MYWSTALDRIRVFNGSVWASVTTDAPTVQKVKLEYVNTCDNVNHVAPNSQGALTVNGIYNFTEGQECNDWDQPSGAPANLIAADTIAYTGGATTVTGHWQEYKFVDVGDNEITADRLSRVIVYTRANLGQPPANDDRDFSQFTVLFSSDAGVTWTVDGKTALEVTSDITWDHTDPNKRMYVLNFPETTGGVLFNRMRIVQTKSLAGGTGITSVVEVELFENV